MPEQKTEIKIVYQDVETKAAIPVTGAFGGVSPDGNAVIAHVYVEHQTVPSFTSVPIKGEVVKMADAQDVRRGEVTREVQAMLVMAPEAALGLGSWLQQKANDALKARATRE